MILQDTLEVLAEEIRNSSWLALEDENRNPRSAPGNVVGNEHERAIKAVVRVSRRAIMLEYLQMAVPLAGLSKVVNNAFKQVY